MAVMIIAENPGQTQQGYDGMLAVLAERIRAAPGFIAHTGFAVEGGWRVVELWQTKEQANQFFAKHVVPHLPPGVHPKRSVQELHSLVNP
jgi:hypothetical protein